MRKQPPLTPGRSCVVLPNTFRIAWGDTGGTDSQFGTCSEAIAHGYGPYYQGCDPEHDWYRDADGDGVVCES